MTKKSEHSTKLHRRRVMQSTLTSTEKLMLIAWMDAWREEAWVSSVGSKEMVRLVSSSLSTVARSRKSLRDASIIHHISGGRGKAETVRMDLSPLERADIVPLPGRPSSQGDTEVEPTTPSWLMSERDEVEETAPYIKITSNLIGGEKVKSQDRASGQPVRASFDEANRIRSMAQPMAKPLKWGTWSDQWRAAFKKAGSIDRLLKAWRVLWFHPEFQWWRTKPAHPHATFLRSKHLPTFFQAADDWDEPDRTASIVSLASLEDTSTPALAYMWVRANAEYREVPRYERTEWLNARVTHPDVVEALDAEVTP